jgi:hypothetical protein
LEKVTGIETQIQDVERPIMQAFSGMKAIRKTTFEDGSESAMK